MAVAVAVTAAVATTVAAVAKALAAGAGWGDSLMWSLPWAQLVPARRLMLEVGRGPQC